MRRGTRLALVALASLAATAAGCGDGGHDHDHAGGDDHGHEAHVHVAPHGGTLVPLGDEFANVEFLLDASTGEVTAWVLDGHAEKPRRVAEPALEVSGTAGGKEFTLPLAPVESALTGEKAGDTSQFRGKSEALRGAAGFRGTLRSITVTGRTFTGVAVEVSGGAPAGR